MIDAVSVGPIEGLVEYNAFILLTREDMWRLVINTSCVFAIEMEESFVAENKAVTTQAVTKVTTSEKVTVTTALSSGKTETATTVSTTKKADETSASVSETTDDTGRKQTAVKGNILLPVICGAILFLVAAVGLASRKRR